MSQQEPSEKMIGLPCDNSRADVVVAVQREAPTLMSPTLMAPASTAPTSTAPTPSPDDDSEKLLKLTSMRSMAQSFNFNSFLESPTPIDLESSPDEAAEKVLRSFTCPLRPLPASPVTESAAGTPSVGKRPVSLTSRPVRVYQGCPLRPTSEGPRQLLRTQSLQSIRRRPNGMGQVPQQAAGGGAVCKHLSAATSACQKIPESECIQDQWVPRSDLSLEAAGNDRYYLNYMGGGGAPNLSNVAEANNLSKGDGPSSLTRCFDEDESMGRLWEEAAKRDEKGEGTGRRRLRVEVVRKEVGEEKVTMERTKLMKPAKGKKKQRAKAMVEALVSPRSPGTFLTSPRGSALRHLVGSASMRMATTAASGTLSGDEGAGKACKVRSTSTSRRSVVAEGAQGPSQRRAQGQQGRWGLVAPEPKHALPGNSNWHDTWGGNNGAISSDRFTCMNSSRGCDPGNRGSSPGVPGIGCAAPALGTETGRGGAPWLQDASKHGTAASWQKGKTRVGPTEGIKTWVASADAGPSRHRRNSKAEGGDLAEGQRSRERKLRELPMPSQARHLGQEGAEIEAPGSKQKSKGKAHCRDSDEVAELRKGQMRQVILRGRSTREVQSEGEGKREAKQRITLKYFGEGSWHLKGKGDQFPRRLAGSCSFKMLNESAVLEAEHRCRRSPGLSWWVQGEPEDGRDSTQLSAVDTLSSVQEKQQSKAKPASSQDKRLQLKQEEHAREKRSGHKRWQQDKKSNAHKDELPLVPLVQEGRDQWPALPDAAEIRRQPKEYFVPLKGGSRAVSLGRTPGVSLADSDLQDLNLYGVPPHGREQAACHHEPGFSRHTGGGQSSHISFTGSNVAGARRHGWEYCGGYIQARFIQHPHRTNVTGVRWHGPSHPTAGCDHPGALQHSRGRQGTTSSGSDWGRRNERTWRNDKEYGREAEFALVTRHTQGVQQGFSEETCGIRRTRSGSVRGWRYLLDDHARSGRGGNRVDLMAAEQARKFNVVPASEGRASTSSRQVSPLNRWSPSQKGWEVATQGLFPNDTAAEPTLKQPPDDEGGRRRRVKKEKRSSSTRHARVCRRGSMSSVDTNFDFGLSSSSTSA